MKKIINYNEISIIYRNHVILIKSKILLLNGKEFFMRNGKKIGLLVTGFAIAFAMVLGVKTKALAFNNGETFTYEKVKYQVTKLAKGENPAICKVIGAEKDAEKITIFANPKYDGETLSCTSINNGAFSGNDDLTYVKISESSKISNIPLNCFKDCDGLKTVIIGTPAVKVINKNAFKGCESLKTVAIKNKTIKKASFKTNCFKGTTGVTIYAPSKSVAKKYASYATKRGAKEVKYGKYKANF